MGVERDHGAEKGVSVSLGCALPPFEQRGERRWALYLSKIISKKNNNNNPEKITEKKTCAYKKNPKVLLIARLEMIAAPRHKSFTSHLC